MRFSPNGFYIEKYVKCDNCGLLVYGSGIKGTRHDSPGAVLLGMVRRVGVAEGHRP